MVPRTYPSTFAANGQQQMVVHFLTSISGLQRWVDYIPVKLTQGGTENSYNNDGFISIALLPELTSQTQAWKEYIPVYQDDAATDAWQVSSIGFIPYNYDKFEDASLFLDFTNGGALDSRITFSRGSNATVTGSNGLIQYAPHNLLTFSEQFDNAAWVKSNATVTANTVVAPNGTLTADKLVANATSIEHLCRGTLTLTATTHTLSVYAKAGEYSWVALTGVSFANAKASFNLSAGTVGTVSGSGSPVASISNAGNGWFRCVLTFTASASSSAYGIAMADGNDSTYFAGNGTSGIYIWGAQLNVGSLQPYYPTTVKNLLGFTESFDNAAWTKSNSFVQTNLLLQSEFAGAVAGTPGTAPASWPLQFSTGSTLVPADGGVTLSATTGNRQVLAQAVSLTANTTYTFSFDVVAVSGPSAEQLIFFQINSGSLASSTTITIAAGVGRKTATLTTGGAGASVTFRVGPGATGPVTSDVSLTLNKIQLVQGTSAGDYQVTYAAAAPVGYTDPFGEPFAQKLVESATTSTHYIYQSGGSAAPYTGSVYAKAGERSWMLLTINSTTTYFNLTTGVLGTVGGGITATISSVGNGWYRCAVTSTLSASGPFVISVVSANNTSSYTGDGTSGIYIFGAQLSDSASVDPYVYNPVAAPTSTAYYGPRFDYDPVTLAPKGLLIEEQRTNLLLQSEDFATTWAPTGATLTTNVALSPAGTVTADRITFTASAASSVTQVVTSSATAHTISVWARAESGTKRFSFFFFNAVNGVVRSSDFVATTTWQRFTFTSTTATTASSWYIANASTADAGSLLFWGAQLEAGAFATSYIPTVASQVTRSADSASMTGTNFSSWWNPSEGSQYAEFSVLHASGADGRTKGIFGGGARLMYLNGTNAFGIFNSINVVQAGTAALAGVFYKGATAYSSAGMAVSFGGGFFAANTIANSLGSISATSLVNIGFDGGSAAGLNGTIKKLAYYPRRLSNTELQIITS